MAGDGNNRAAREENEVSAVIAGLVRRRCPRLSSQSVRVEFHENTSTVVSRSRDRDRVALRLHRVFLSAPDAILDGIVRCFLNSPPRGTAQLLRRALKDFVEVHRHALLRPVEPTELLPPRGRVHDLAEILDAVRTVHLPQLSPVLIGWSPRLLQRLMGKWIENLPPRPNAIMINRLLDCEAAPRSYLEFLVFHELLHEAIPVRRVDGRWIHHSREFRSREREFPGYRAAVAWEKASLSKLYRAALRQEARKAAQRQ